MGAQDFLTQAIYPGVGGVDLKRTPENVQPLKHPRMTNLTRPREGAVEPRPGLTRLLTSGLESEVHSVRRLNDPIEGIFTRVFGIGTELWAGRGDDEPARKVDEGYSGDPLSFVVARSPLSGESWLLVADRKRMRKLRVDKLVLPIGLPAPELPATVALADEEMVLVEDFGIGAAWRGNAGTGSIPSAVSVPGGPAGPAGANYTRFQSAIGSTTGAYYNYWNREFYEWVDMSRLGASGREASDSDFIQFWIRMDRPDRIGEIKVYFVISDDFDLTVLPGTSGSANTNAYVKSFRPTDFTDLLENVETAIDVVATVKERSVLTESLTKTVETRDGAAAELAASLDESRGASRQATFGRDQWIQLTQVGFPLRRGEFLRIGNDPELSWSRVYGMVISVLTTELQPVQVSFDDLTLTGGHGPDSVQPGSQRFDYIYRHYDPRTGARGNFAPFQAEDFHLDAMRRAVEVTPKRYDSSLPDSSPGTMRQEFFRRGGTLVEQYNYVGRNGGDGFVLSDSVSDATAEVSGRAVFDNYQPVPTTNADGTVVKGEPLPSIWGPIAGVVMGCGDKYRPGTAWWCKPDEPDHWTPFNRVDVCAASEELLVGHDLQGQAFVFSRARLYSLTPSVTPVGVTFAPRPTACNKGPITRWASCVTPYGIAFAAYDGVYLTTGASPISLSDDDVWPLFNRDGQGANGYLPVDFAHPKRIRLAYHDNELWLGFRDTAGRMQWWIFYFSFKIWRHYRFEPPDDREVVAAFSEDGSGGFHAPVEIAELEESEFMSMVAIAPLVPAGSTTVTDMPDEPRPVLILSDDRGRAYTHEGYSDDGEEIAWTLDTAALNQGMVRETKQYGDVVLDADRQGESITVEALVDEGQLGLVPRVVLDETYADPEQGGLG